MAEEYAVSDGSDAVPPNVQLNMADLKREENILLSIYSKMAEQLHRLEVEELGLRQKLRKRDMDQTISLMSPNPVDDQTVDDDSRPMAPIYVETEEDKDASYYPYKVNKQVTKEHNEIEDFLDNLVTSELYSEGPELTLSPKQKLPSLTGSPRSSQRTPRSSHQNVSEIKNMRHSKKVDFVTSKLSVDDMPVDLDLSLVPRLNSSVEEEDDD